jgi:hypothetical protein
MSEVIRHHPPSLPSSTVAVDCANSGVGSSVCASTGAGMRRPSSFHWRSCLEPAV